MPSDSRRSFLFRLSAVSALVGGSGCTALTSVDATIRFVNDYKYEETATFSVSHGTERSNGETVHLSPGEERVFERSVKREDAVVVVKESDSLSLSFKLQRSVCLDPELEVNIGGNIAGGWGC